MAMNMISNMAEIKGKYKVSEIINSLNIFSKVHADDYKDALEVYQNEIIFHDQQQARVYSELFIGINKNHYASHFSILFHKLIQRF